MTTAAQATIAPSPATLEANLAAVSHCSLAAASQIRAAFPCAELEFLPTDEPGAPSATLSGRLLASRRRPLDEAARLAETVDLRAAAVIVVMGFGLGHHVAALARRMKRDGLIVVFEPDVALLRAVFERIDHTSWLRETNILFLTDPDDGPAITAALQGAEGLLALGTRILDHPASRARLGDTAARFGERFARAVAAVRTVVITTMVQSEVTVRNCLMNLDHYTRRDDRGGPLGVADLAGACRGAPAVVVSAGPSLARNIHLLAQPGVRDRVVIIAVQTALKTLLAHGVKPHFVTALDYHEISRRFYEGLSPADVEGVTLVAEAKANPAILDSFPGAGAVRCVGDDTLDLLLGPDLTGAHGALPPGATVAHLAYYLARHLACDPVILIGQDLGFTDGQYYASGAAIHSVWAGELNPFNSLETMEWQRIARSRRTLRRATDHLGRPVYTDEQMATYLAQFERDFMADAQRGLTIIDATEGGVAKRHAVTATLADALARSEGAAPLSLPHARAAASGAGASVRKHLLHHLRAMRRDFGRLTALSRRTQSLLQRMLDHHDDQRLVNKLIADVDKVRDEVQSIQPAFALVQKLNQTGGFKRARADRDMRLDASLSPLELQRRQIERDRTNVEWIGDAADSLATMLDDAMAALNGAPKRTRDPAPEPATHSRDAASASPRARTTLRAAAVIPVDHDRSPLGVPRSLDAHFRGTPLLRVTLARLSRCKHIDSAILLSTDPARTRALTTDRINNIRIHVERIDPAALRARADRLRPARALADSSWRGGLCGATIYDELLHTAPAAAALIKHTLDAALLVGPDWALVDPALCDSVIERWRERPDAHRLTFTQAPPGLAGCVIDRRLLEELARSHDKGGPFASIGGLLGYVPVNPQPDPIAHAVCAPVTPTVRDALFRFIPDSAARTVFLDRALANTPADAPAELIAAAIESAAITAAHAAPGPAHLILELTPRRASKPAPWLFGAAAQRPDMPRALAEQLISAAAALRDDLVISFEGAGDPLLHPEWRAIAEHARSLTSRGIHIRTDLLCDAPALDALLDGAVDIVSVNLMAQSATIYEQLMGVDGFRRALEHLDALLKRRTTFEGLPSLWVAPRITRCDAVYEELETFYDKWLLLAGAAVIDPLPNAAPDQRITPLALPRPAALREARNTMFVRSDGAVTLPALGGPHTETIADLSREPLEAVWPRLLERRAAAFR